MKKAGLKIGAVSDGSIATEVGLEQGDTILSLNGHPLTDILDYYFYTRDSLVSIDLLKQNGEQWDLEIEKDPDQDLGVDFECTGLESITRCANKCIFCFVDQMPGGLRGSLYVKDDDYRLSFMQGSFITLTNMSFQDFKRIARLRLSPLYVSVHATNPELRVKILGNPRAGDIYKRLQYLAGKGIEIHTQAVICPGVNDGDELDRTVADMVSLWPGVRSLAVVPVGLTAQREGLSNIRNFTQQEAALIVNKVKGWQDCCLKSFDYPFVFAGDEFYFLADARIPPLGRYADFPQTENGVGLTRLFMDEWRRAKRKIPAEMPRPLKISLVTGLLGKRILDPVVERLNRVNNLEIAVVAVKNKFFGESVTVAGLLTGQDILKKREELKDSHMVIMPAAVLRKDGRVMLDGMTVEELAEELGVSVRMAEGPYELVNIIKESNG